jgi:N-acetylglutamate synthase-like GNAT family acetyltransferase
MSPSNHRVRRATLEDLPGLRVLWELMHLPAADLERRLTEFQVVESTDGRLVGALGIQIFRQHAWLHSESYLDFALADEARPLLLARLQSLASNHGVFRLWTREKSPFWTRHGFKPATPEELKKLPEPWLASGPEWLTLQLKDEQAIISLEKELSRFMESEKQRTLRTFQHVRTLKQIATFVALIGALFVLGAVFYLLHKGPGIFPRMK